MARKIELEVEVGGIGKINSEIDKLQSNLSEMKTQLKGFKEGSDEFNRLSQSISQTESELRNLGGAIEETTQEQITLNQQIGEAEDKLMLMAQAGDTSSQAYRDLIEEVGKMKKIQMDTNAQVDRAAAGFAGKLTLGVQRVAAAYQVGMAATQMFGVESEKAQKIMAQLQAVMAFTQGIEQLKQLTVGMKLFGQGGIAALSGIKKAIVATGIGALVVAVGLLVAYWEDIVDLIGLGESEQEKMVKTSEKKVQLAEQELTAFDSSVNSLKLQGKSEKEILELRLQKIDAIIAEQQIYISALEERRKQEIESAQQSKAITEGIIRGIIEVSTMTLRALAAPIDLLLTTVNQVSEFLGLGEVTAFRINDEISKINATLSEKAAGLLFDPEKVAEEGQAAIDEAKAKLDKLVSDRDGMRLQIQQIEKQEVENSKAAEEEKQQKLRELRAEELEIIKGIEARKVEARKTAEDLTISMMEDGLEKQTLLLERQYGAERQAMIEKSNELEIKALEEKFVEGLVNEEQYLAELQRLRADDSRLSDEERALLLLKEKKKNDEILKLTIDRDEKLKTQRKAYEDFIKGQETDEQQRRINAAEKSYGDDLDKLKKFLDDKTITQEEYDEAVKERALRLNGELDAIDKEFRDKTLSRLQSGFNLIQSGFDMLKDGAAGLFGSIGSSLAGGLTQILEVGKMKFDEFDTQIQNTAQKVNAYAQAIGGMIQSVLGAVSEEQQARLEENLERVEETYNAETAALEQQRQQGLITEEQFAQRKYQIDLKKFNEEEKLRKNAFENEKAMKIASTITSGLMGAVSAFAGAMQLGPIAGPIVGGILAGVVGAMTAVNVAQIAATQYKGGSPPTPPSGLGDIPGGGGTTGVMSAPQQSATTLFGEAMTGGNLGGQDQSAGERQQPIRAYVLETDITTTQNTISTYEQRAEIG